MELFSRQFFNLALISCLSIVFSPPALAMGEYYIRMPKSNTFAACDKKLFERYDTGSDIHSIYDEYFLGCLSDKTHADWVLISGFTCYDDTDQQRCVGYNKRMPRFADGLFLNRRMKVYPFSVHLLKYGFGKNCHSQKVSVLNRGIKNDQPYWNCDTIEIYNGEGVDSPALVTPNKVVDIKTLGPTDLAVYVNFSETQDDKLEPSFEPSFRFPLQSDQYLLSYFFGH